MRVCIVGAASGKLEQYVVRHALDRRYEVVGVCRKQSVGKLDKFKGRAYHGRSRSHERPRRD
jgi:putative NADH-flavin reductase